MASLNFIAAFDMVNIKKIKPLDIIGILANVVSLIEAWLTERLFYVSVEGGSSCLTTSGLLAIQGLILCPILYATFIPHIGILKILELCW